MSTHKNPHERRGDGGVVAGVYSSTHVLLVLDPWYAKPMWKLPGGAIERSETAKQAGARETYEETGVKILPRVFRFLHATYGKHIVLAQVPGWQIKKHAVQGKSGEFSRLFTFEEALELPNLLPQHSEYIKIVARRARKSLNA